MKKWKTLADMRREYGELNLNEKHLAKTPIAQFKLWFEEVSMVEQSDPTAMVLSTVDEEGHPDSRVVLLKGIEGEEFLFYTNYQSSKAVQLELNPFVALNFYWPQMSRQVRIRGSVKRVSKEQSDRYFASRPLSSQLSAIISPQSQKVQNRDILEQALHQLLMEQGDDPVLRPDFWGGYSVLPAEIEFWQGRDNRLHDRILFFKQNGIWMHHCLAP